MELVLQRKPNEGDGCTGTLTRDGVFECLTLEDTVQPPKSKKIPGRTAIPASPANGYEVALEESPKFGANCLTIRDVPGFDHIRMHGGNTPGDTLGCVLLGYKLLPGPRFAPGTSRPAVEVLRTRVLQAQSRGEKVRLVIKDAP